MRPPEMIPSELLSSGLAWFWKSIRSGPQSEWSKPELPETRNLTRLTQDSAQTFVDDFRDNWRGLEGREILVVGTKADFQESDSPGMGFEDALLEFAREGCGPVQVVAYLEDDGDEVMYIAWPLCEPVRGLLSSWVIRPDEISEITWSTWSAWQTTGLEGLTTHIFKQSTKV